jgi:hypothetical protein
MISAGEAIVENLKSIHARKCGPFKKKKTARPGGFQNPINQTTEALN